MNENAFTDQDRACVNCKHFSRNWNPYAILDVLIDNGSSHYRCSYDGVEQSIDPVTGKIKIKVTTSPCLHRRRNMSSICGVEGKNWEPSDSFLKKKENLFKVLSIE